MKKIIDWHKAFIENAQKELNLSTYQMYLSGFLEGALFLWVVMKVSAVIRVKSEFPFEL